MYHRDLAARFFCFWGGIKVSRRKETRGRSGELRSPAVRTPQFPSTVKQNGDCVVGRFAPMCSCDLTLQRRLA